MLFTKDMSNAYQIWSKNHFKCVSINEMKILRWILMKLGVKTCRWVTFHHGMARPQVADGGKSSRYGG
jgi:hypothetical protein